MNETESSTPIREDTRPDWTKKQKKARNDRNRRAKISRKKNRK
jgi:hypothetical protein